MRYTLYFAYGSNMNEQQFRERCPSSHFLCRAKLPDYRFIITSRGYANILKKEDSTVYGVLCAITESDEKELDRREGVYRNIYRREWLPVITEFGYAISSLVYVDNTEDEGVPNNGYLEKVLEGARRHSLPAEAVIEIEGWSKKK
jgi:gamma-glutamylcyclotransferase (GGCT)/AIG2-like uncharacterized protein YtfP